RRVPPGAARRPEPFPAHPRRPLAGLQAVRAPAVGAGGRVPREAAVRAASRALLALLLLAGCVDFVDPVGLGLARDTRIEVDFDLVDDPRSSPCPAPAPLPADTAVLCVRAIVTPGITSTGERLRVLDDTLWAMGVAILPADRTGGALRYQARFALPEASLEQIPYTAVLPRVEGVELRSREIRWYAVGREGPDTLPLLPGGGVRLGIDLPAGVSTPAPAFQFWTVEMAGDT